jgi:hypothetical protein
MENYFFNCFRCFYVAVYLKLVFPVFPDLKIFFWQSIQSIKQGFL